MSIESKATHQSVHCVIHTPLAYLCLREYLARFPYHKRHLYVLATSRAAYDGIASLQASDDWTNIRPLSRGRTMTLLDRCIAPLRLTSARWRLGRILNNIGNEDDVVLSHLNNPFSRFVIKRSRHLARSINVVDDGTTTLSEFGALTRTGSITTDNYTNRSTSWNARLERLLFSDAPIYAGDVKYFSFWPLQEMKNERSPSILATHDFSHLRKARPANPPLPFAYIIGQPFVRRGLLDGTRYARILAIIAANYLKEGLTPIYFPHRNEIQSQIPLSLEVRRIDQPFELYLCDSEHLPQKIAGFYSNSLVTTKHLFAEAVEHELFWGFSDLSPEKASSPDIAQMLEREAARLSAFTINRTLRLP